VFTTNLRKVGGSVMLAVPPALLEVLDLKPGTAVGIAIEGGRLVVEPTPRPRYTLEELLAASNFGEALSSEDRDWLDTPARGKEIL